MKTETDDAILDATEDDLVAHCYEYSNSLVAHCGYVSKGRAHSMGINPPADVCQRCLVLWKLRWPEYARSIGL